MIFKNVGTRDLQELQEIGIFVQEGAGRSLRDPLIWLKIRTFLSFVTKQN